MSLVSVLSSPGSRIDPLPVLVRSVRLQGIVVGSVSMFERASRTLEALGLRPVVDEVIPFDRAPEGLAKLEEGRHFGKAVVRGSECEQKKEAYFSLLAAKMERSRNRC